MLIFFLDENDEFNLNGFAFDEKEFLDFGFLDLEKDLFVIPVDNGDNGVLTWNKLLLCNKFLSEETDANDTPDLLDLSNKSSFVFVLLICDD